eukprot:m.18755 g.18755  ORF g.18755 m.18755 type:complete len:233 (+) comp12189_c1_seq1:173-871(+)
MAVLMLRYTNRMEMFFYIYISVFTLFVVVGLSSDRDYGFISNNRFWMFLVFMFASPIQYWIVWNYPHKVMKVAGKIKLHGVEFTHHLVGFITFCKMASYVYAVDGGRLMQIYDGTFETRPFDLLVFASLIAGQALNLSVYNVLGVNGVNYGRQMDRPIPWIEGFPFNTGTRHPQYIGCVVAWLSLFTLITPTEHYGQLVVSCWATCVSYYFSGELEVEADSIVEVTTKDKST